MTSWKAMVNNGPNPKIFCLINDYPVTNVVGSRWINYLTCHCSSQTMWLVMIKGFLSSDRDYTPMTLNMHLLCIEKYQIMGEWDSDGCEAVISLLTFILTVVKPGQTQQGWSPQMSWENNVLSKQQRQSVHCCIVEIQHPNKLLLLFYIFNHLLLHVVTSYRRCQ